MSSIFGGSKQKSSSSNQAYSTIANAYTPLLSYVSDGASGLASLLSGDSSGLDAYKTATGYDATAEQGSTGITDNAAAGGLLRSGATSKALQNYGTTLSNQYATNYASQLATLAGLGLSAGSTLTSAGSTSSSSGSSKNGISSLLGAAASGTAAG